MTVDFPRHACAYAERLAATCAPFRLQLEPDAREDEADGFAADPFGENGTAAGVYGLKQRFPDRVLVMTSDSCFMNCRHCTRKGLLREAEVVRTDEELQNCVEYVKTHPQVRDVLLSGGDPLVLPDDEILRFVEPQRLRVCGKVWVNTQFNCAGEMTAEAAAACGMLVDAGVPVSCQTVLLAGVNDSVEAMLALFRALQRARVRPYYVFQCDPVAGVSHFRVSVEKAKEIAAACAERIGGLALPRFVADIPGASRKIPIEDL